MCMVGDDDYWETFTSKKPKARKDHVCDECGRTIVKGEVYSYEGGLSFESDGFTFYKTCAHCKAVCEWLIAICEGYLYNGVQEDIGNHVDGDEEYLNSPPLETVVGWMRTDWRDDNGELRDLLEVERLVSEAITEAKAVLATIADSAKAS